jgi:16S rRNA (uracil1498-N3)-methyltransferase
MILHRLFCQELRPGPVTLGGEEAHHAIAVLRARPGQRMVLFDGAGGEAEATVSLVGRRHLDLEAGPVADRPFEFPRRVTLAVAMPRRHRQAYLIEKCTELGVWAFWPVIARRSVTRPDAAAVDKWARRAIEAAKQSQRAFVPTFEPPRLITACLDRSNEFDALVMAHRTHPGKGWADFLKNHPDKLSILVFVGPEGGWSDEEVGACLAAGAHPVCLGPTVLRTETAAIAVCAAVALEQRSD